MQSDITKLEIIKHKIIKTDEVLKILVEKKNEVSRINAKYQTLLDKFSDKCKELQKLTVENKSLTIKNEEIQNKIVSLEQQYLKAKSSYETLEKTYNSYVNNAACKYQNLSTSLAETTRKYQEELNRVRKLEATVADLKNKPLALPKRSRRKCAKTPENKQEQQKHDIGQFRTHNEKIGTELLALRNDKDQLLEQMHDVTSESKQLQDKQVPESTGELKQLEDKQVPDRTGELKQLQDKQMPDMISELKQLQGKQVPNVTSELKQMQHKLSYDSQRNSDVYVEVISCCDHEQDIINFKNQWQENVTSLESKLKTLENLNSSLKDRLSISKRNTSKLKETIAELQLELNILNDKNSNVMCAFTQTDPPDDDFDAADAVLNEMCSVPRIITPFQDFEDDESFLRHDFDVFNMNEADMVEAVEPLKIPEIIITPPTPVATSKSIKSVFDAGFCPNTEFEIPNLTKSCQKEVVSKLSNSNNKEDETIVIKNSNVSIIVQNGSTSTETGALITEAMANSVFSTSLENGVFRYNLLSCYSPNCKHYYSLLKYNDEHEPDFLGFDLEEDEISCRSKVPLISGSKLLGAPKKVLRRVRTSNFKKLSGIMYKNIIKDICAVLSQRNKLRKRKRLQNKPIHQKEHCNSFSDSDQYLSETESEVMHKPFHLKENSSLLALRRSNRILQRKLLRERRLLKLTKPAQVSEDFNESNSVVQNENDVFNENIYETEQHSVDSGYSAHIIGESDGSEAIPEKRKQIESVSCYKKQKLELFGSGSDSDSSTSVRESPKRKTRSSVKTAKKRKCLLTKQTNSTSKKTNTSISFEEPLLPIIHSQPDDGDNRNVFKKPSPILRQSRKCNNSKDIHENEENNQEIEKCTNLSTAVKLSCDTSVKKPIITKKDCGEQVKTSFKRPNCRSRIPETPRSPERCEKTFDFVQPKIIPLEKPKPLSKIVIKKLFEKLLTYPEEGEILQEVADKFANQETTFIARLVINQVASDFYDSPDAKYTPPAPLMTVTQRTLMGFMLKLEKVNCTGLLSCFLAQAEKQLLMEKRLECISPLARLYSAILKMQKDIHRLRRTCLEALYFMGNLAVPFVYAVLSCWAEVLPKHSEKGDEVLVKVLVKFLSLKDCQEPGYNCVNLRTMFTRMYKYTYEEWNIETLFTEAVTLFQNTRSRQAELAILIICKNQPSLWVSNQINKQLKSILNNSDDVSIKGAAVSLIGKIMNQFDTETDAEIIMKTMVWLEEFRNDCTLKNEDFMTECEVN